MPAVRFSPEVSVALGAFVPRAKALLGDTLVEIRLFGSVARGEATEDSDVDLLVLVREGGWARRREVQDLAWDLSLEHGVQLAPTVMEEQRFAALVAGERLFARDVERDGVRL